MDVVFASKSDIDTFYQFTVALIVFKKKILANPRLILLKDVFSQGALGSEHAWHRRPVHSVRVSTTVRRSAHFNNSAQYHLFKWAWARITSAQASPREVWKQLRLRRKVSCCVPVSSSV